ncbi:uncharacterized protein AMSG_00126 [Thecamonas trahens ATCC 50062]|uniref:DUF4139 domain-containing protein n=1 Tax=Thecamonas trahens ATCC 50062 TaxID=461836 RepID=A0A0L0D3X6_THETB|nr:hypothetical protein AMSG_00126 [Thecamonas trahens ATCC 50062]KNC46008.1 hypothetical protein AMSG_00126 [Thecamonas trahens ATCC 50062]|eukprot:XP_013762988.1 hypothetical protein AMSG_00126 [Thecamonas trahens ATCC 50062]
MAVVDDGLIHEWAAESAAAEARESGVGVVVESSTVSKVTVFSDHAEVVRSVRASVPSEGRHVVVVNGLPAKLDPNSVRAAVHGGARVRGVKVTTSMNDIATSGAAAGGGSSEDRYAAKARCEVKRRMLAAFAQSMARPDSTSGRVRSPEEMVAFLGWQKTELARLETSEAGRDGGLTCKNSSQASTAVAVDIDAPVGGSLVLAIAYVVVGCAGWAPSYVVHVDRLGGAMEVAMRARVWQATGEAWQLAQMVVSTGAAGNGRVPPSGVAVTATVAAEGERQGSAVDGNCFTATYDVLEAAEIAPDGAQHEIGLIEFELETEVRHVCRPRQAPTALMLARALNTSRVALAPGVASVFVDGGYVGTCSLGWVPPGQALVVPLGSDNEVRVDRQRLAANAHTSGWFKSARRETYAFRVDVASSSALPVALEVCDTLPQPEHPRVRVVAQELPPGTGPAFVLGPDAQLTWSGTLAPGESVSIVYSYAVEHPSGLVVQVKN